MGGGQNTPTDSPVKESGQSFENRKSSPVTDGVSSSDSDTNSKDSSSPTGEPKESKESEGSKTGQQTEQSHPEGGGAARRWRDSGSSVVKAAATADYGYDPELASRVKSTDTTTLESQFTEAKTALDSDDVLGETDRFVGGVLTSRSDSDITATDVYEIQNLAGDIDIDASEVAGVDTVELPPPEELTRRVEENVNEMFRQMDEYTAGRTASVLTNITIQDIEPRDSGFRPGGNFSPSGRSIRIDPSAHHAGRGVHDVESHEIAHATQYAFNMAAATENTPLSDDFTPESLQFQTKPSTTTHFPEDGVGGMGIKSDSATQFRKNIESLGSQLKQSKLGDVNDNMRDDLGEYQMTNASELFAVGFGRYNHDFVTVSNAQPGMVDHIDEFVTTQSWSNTSIDDVTKSGVGFDHPAKNNQHIPDGMSENDVGEVVKVNFTEEVEHSIDSWTGYAIESGSNDVAFVSNGNVHAFPEEHVDSVEVRNW